MPRRIGNIKLPKLSSFDRSNSRSSQIPNDVYETLIWQRNQILVLKEQVKMLMKLVEARSNPGPMFSAEQRTSENVNVDGGGGDAMSTRYLFFIMV